MAFDPLVIAKGLEDIFLQIRQRATPCRYDGVSVREPIVYLDGTTRDDPQPGETLHAFPEVRSIIDGVKHQALVMLDGGIDPLVLMYPFVNALLAGDSNGPIKQIEEVRVTVRSPKLEFVDRTHPEAKPFSERQHYLYKFTWHDGKTYAVDVTAAQFGHGCPIRAWRKAELGWGMTVEDVFPLGHVRRAIYPDFGPNPDRVLVSQRLETMELAQYLAENFVLNARQLSNQEQIEELVEELEDCVDVAMEDLYSSEKISERLKEIEAKLQVVHVDDPESTELFLSFVKKGLLEKGG